MLPARLLSYDVHPRRHEVLPRYLGAADDAWLRDLLERFEFLAGKPRSEVQRALAAPLAGRPDPKRVAMATHVLTRACGWEPPPGSPAPQVVRSSVFLHGAREPDRPRALALAAAELRLAPRETMTRLFADLPSHRTLRPVDPDLNVRRLALETNLALAQGLLRTALHVTVRAHGGARRLVRQAILTGLICTVHPEDAAEQESFRLEVSGPYALFRRTTVYGRALAQLVPLLPWCDRYDLRAQCELEGARRRFRIQRGDPLPAAPEPRRYDSKLEERFARDFTRLDPGGTWRLVREPQPVPAEGTLIFPDFALVHRHDPARSWLLEIVGFWTADYLSEKLRRLEAAGLERLVICIDQDRACDSLELPASSLVVPFRRRVPAAEVLRRITQETLGGAARRGRALASAGSSSPLGPGGHQDQPLQSRGGASGQQPPHQGDS